MQLPVPPPEVARVGLRAIKMVAMADGTFHDLERGLMMGAQRHILGTDHDLDALEPITPGELAIGLPEPFRERVLGACVITALIDGEASPAEVAVLDAHARALGLESAALESVRRLVDEQLLRLRLDIMRRSFLGQRLGDFVRRRGFRGLASVARGLMDHEHPPTAARYHALANSPAGTLGRGYYDFVKRNGFSFPGEKGAAPEPIVFHDCLHVLAGYDISSLEETQIAAFQAGTMKRDPIFGLLFGLAQFHLGVQITPTTEGERGVVDPELMLRAFVRGTHVVRDMCADWQPWDDFDRPVEDLRRTYNILPRE